VRANSRCNIDVFCGSEVDPDRGSGRGGDGASGGGGCGRSCGDVSNFSTRVSSGTYDGGGEGIYWIFNSR